MGEFEGAEATGPAYCLAFRHKSHIRFVGRVLRKEGKPMGKFLENVLAMILAGVIVALVLRYLA